MPLSARPSVVSRAPRLTRVLSGPQLASSRSLCLVAFASALVAASAVVAMPAGAAAPVTPRSITAMTAQPGPRVGEVTFYLIVLGWFR